MMIKNFKGSGPVLAAALAAVGLLGAGVCRREPEPPPVSAGIRLDLPAQAGLAVLDIEGSVFTNADFARFVRTTIGDEDAAALAEEAASRLFDDFVERRLILHRAAAESVSLTEEEKSDYLSRLRAAMGGEAAERAQAIPDPEGLFEGLLVEKYLSSRMEEISVSESEATAYYEERKADFLRPERVQVSQILLASEGRASDVLDRLRGAGEDAFRAAARTESMGPEASKGGVMGVFSPGQLPQELEKVIFSLNEGQISRVVQSLYGFHIFRLDRMFEPRLLSSAEALPRIQARIRESRKQDALAVLLDEIKERLTWSVETAHLPFIYQRMES